MNNNKGKEMPKSIVFVKGKYKGMAFTQGEGPTVRESFNGHISVLRNSPNFWYNSNYFMVSAQYLNDNESHWTPSI